jgi:hypothetical protein
MRYSLSIWLFQTSDSGTFMRGIWGVLFLGKLKAQQCVRLIWAQGLRPFFKKNSAVKVKFNPVGKYL